MSVVRRIQIGENHKSAEVLNRPTDDILTLSGQTPGATFAGFATVPALAAEATARAAQLDILSGSPDGVVTSTPGALREQVDAMDGNMLWQKASGTGPTGWALIHRPINLGRMGADLTGSSDMASMFAAALTRANAIGRREVEVEGLVRVDTPISLVPGVSIRMAPDAAVKAGAVMGAVFTSPLATLLEDTGIHGGFVLCNSLADVGIDLQFTRHFMICDVVIQDAMVNHILAGNAAAPGSSYETVIRNVRCHRPSSAVPVGSIGIRLRFATDCLISDTVVVGGETGIKMETGGNHLSNVHAWVRASTGAMLVGFDDGGNQNGYINCYADCPTQYGWLIRNRGSQRIIGCTTYQNAGVGLAGNDNVAYAVRFEHADPNATVLGLTAYGQNATSRFAGDFSFAASKTNVTIWGCANTNVTATTPAQMAGGNKFDDLTISSILHMTGQAWLSGETQLLQTGATIPDYDNVADSADGATLITTQGSVISSADATRRVWRFRQSGTGKAGTGGIAFGNFDASDQLLHSLLPGQLRLDLLDYTQAPDTLANRLLIDGNGLSWNGGAQIKKHKTVTGTWDPPSVAAGAQTTTTLAVSGVVVGDVISVSFDKDLQGMTLTGYVSGAGTVTVVLRNGTGSAIDLASGTLRAIAWQY